MRDMQTQRSLKSSMTKGSKWWFPHNARLCIKRRSLLARAIFATTRRKIVTFVPSKTSCPMSLPIPSAARSTTGSARRDFVIVVFTMGSAPRTRTVGGSCDWCSKISRRNLKLSMRHRRRFMPEERLAQSILLGTSKEPQDRWLYVTWKRRSPGRDFIVGNVFRSETDDDNSRNCYSDREADASNHTCDRISSRAHCCHL